MENDTHETPDVRILVIDDEEVVHASLKRILGRQGYHVYTALKAQQGLDLLETTAFDMVITDLMMPEMNGIELLAEIKRRGLAVPVLMITGYPTIKTALQVLRLGAVDYLAKPFTRAELLAPVARALRHQTSEDSVVGNDPFEEGGSWGTPMPGDRYRLRHHSWIVYQQDGTVLVGIERSFLGTIGTIEGARLPSEAELVEQGYVGILLTTTSGEEHGVLMPLSGRVMAVNPEPVAAPGSINDSMWLVRILPDRLKQELTLLVPEPKPA